MGPEAGAMLAQKSLGIAPPPPAAPAAPAVDQFHSPTLGKIAEALSKAQATMGGAGKDKSGNYGTYATLASVWDACRGPLSAQGIAVIQMPSSAGRCVTLRTTLIHSSGEFIGCEVAAEAVDASPQKVGSVITYLRRYSLMAMAGIAPEDDDGQSAQPPDEKKTYKKPAPAPKEEDRNQAAERDAATAKSKAKGLVANATLAARASKVWTDFKAKAPAGSGEQADGFRLWIKRILGAQKGSPEWTLDDVVKLEVALTANDLTSDERCDVGDGKK